MSSLLLSFLFGCSSLFSVETCPLASSISASIPYSFSLRLVLAPSHRSPFIDRSLFCLLSFCPVYPSRMVSCARYAYYSHVGLISICVCLLSLSITCFALPLCVVLRVSPRRLVFVCMHLSMYTVRPESCMYTYDRLDSYVSLSLLICFDRSFAPDWHCVSNPLFTNYVLVSFFIHM